MSQINRKKLCKKPARHIQRKLGKKGFIASILVDFWAIIMFVLVVVIFAFLYKWASSKSAEKLSNFHGTMWNNYLAEMYLRTPIEIQNVDMTMAELIALYDYNQTRAREIEKKTDKKDTTLDKVWGSIKEVFAGNTVRQGDDNILYKALEKLTNEYLDTNFDSFNTCWLFGIEGSGFRFMKTGSVSKCFKYASATDHITHASTIYRITKGVDGRMDYSDLRAMLDDVPENAYLTTIPPIDPRDKPIKLIVVYDIEKTIKLKDDSDD